MCLDTVKEVEYLRKMDTVMDQLISRVGKFSIKMKKDPYLALVESITFQQLTGKAAQSIYEKFMSYYEYHPTPEIVFCTKEKILRTFGFSNRKIEYIKLLSRDILKGNIVLANEFLQQMNDKEIINYLTKFKGIGLWTTQMFMIFHLGRMDVFPVNDLAIKKAVQKWYFPRKQKNLVEIEIMKISDRWKPYRSIATWYLWKSMSRFDSIG